MQYQIYRLVRRTSGAVAIAACAVLACGTPARAQTTPAAGGAAFAQAVQLQDSGKAEDAIPLLKQAIAGGYQPVNAARLRLARAYARTGSPDLALQELETLATAGFAVIPLMASKDFDSLREVPRFKAVETKVSANAHPCAADPRFHQFDFWIGEWDVQPTGATRAPIGSGSTSIIEPQLEGCVVQENWQPIGGIGAGKSFNIYNTTTKLWQQYYVDSLGTITLYTGSFHDDGNLYYEANQFGTSNKIRMTFFNQGTNQVRQLGQVSTDGGKTWAVTYDLTYVRKKPKAE